MKRSFWKKNYISFKASLHNKTSLPKKHFFPENVEMTHILKGLRILQTFVEGQLLFLSKEFLINDFVFMKKAQRILNSIYILFKFGSHLTV